ncbi:MAG: hypothetical protein GC145_02625 [Caulobacter sp.]|nr:hypothetical protein [Caulobacter sp.]
MKILIRTLAAVTALGLAAAATAASAQESVTLAGSAEKVCTLPDSWAFVSGAAGASGSQFSGTTWTIPESAFAAADSTAVIGSEYAIRIRGAGFCNTSHTISLTSSNGGLTTGSPAAAAPAGFSKRRVIKYQAYWSNGSGGNTGPNVTLNASTPNQQTVGTYTVSGALPPPGNRNFDIRLGMARGALSGPLLAGDYSDTVTVTLSIIG